MCDANVLQTSNRLAFTNTNIRKGCRYYDRMLYWILDEPKNIQAMRRDREKHRLTAVHAFHTSKNIKPSGTKRK